MAISRVRPISLIDLMRNTLAFATLAAAVLSATSAIAQSKPSDWDKIVEAAKKEGKVVASIPPSPELRKTYGLER